MEKQDDRGLTEGEPMCSLEFSEFLYSSPFLKANVAPGKFVKKNKHSPIDTLYRTRAIITRGLYTFYPLFEVHLCSVTFGLMYG